MPDGKADRKIITTAEVRKAINGKVYKNNWKTEQIKEGGEETIPSIATLFNKVEEENKILIQWRETKINSVYTRGNKARIQESQRGKFLMNILCQV